MRRTSPGAAMLVGLLLVSGCTGEPVTPESTPASPTPATSPATRMPEQATTVIGGASPAQLAVATSRTLYASSPAAVLVGAADEASLPDAVSTAERLGVPLLLTPGTEPAGDGGPTGTDAATQDAAQAQVEVELRAEIERLGPGTLVTVGDSAHGWASAPNLEPERPLPPALRLPTGDGALPAVDLAPALQDLLVLALDQPASRAAVATARASGARVILLADPDPRMSDEAIKALASQSSERILALGEVFGSADVLRRRVQTAATGVLLPGGGQVVFPGRRMVALYGHPGSTVLGSLGEQPVDRAITRARDVAASYQSLVNEPVIPAFEIIATVASRGAGADGDYSSESSIAHLRPWVDAAKEAGIYVLLDLQPGRTDFLTQAKLYAELLQEPHVGLALDPEWRLAPGQLHMVQIGSVSGAEINATAAWLAELTRTHRLPQKILMLHQFRLDMITDRASLNTSHDELRVVIHADGFGSAGQKYNTWNTLHRDAPASVWWGWKNFYDEDRPTFTPAETVAVSPSPVFISYQ